MRKLFCAAVVAAGLLAITAGNAGAADYPATTGTLSATALSASEVRVEGCGFAPGATVQLRVDSADAGSTTASAEGCISTTVTISAESATVTATGLNTSGGTLTLTVNLSSSNPGAGSSAGGFARTGANSMLIAGVAIALLAVGGLFAVVTRRRSVTG